MPLALLYMVGVSAFMLIHRIWFSPDQFFVFAAVGMLLIGRGFMFIRDWGPFLIYYLTYEYLRGLVPYITKYVHIWPMIRFDTAIFGVVPADFLQSHLYNPGHLMWYDYVTVLAYISFFVVPMIAGFAFWLADRKYFRTFSWGYLALAYLAFGTYIAFPAMPPWMAAANGYIPPLTEITPTVMSHFLTTSVSLPSVYNYLRANPVAAMPSLHAAMPMLVALFGIRKWKWSAIFLVPYVLTVCFAVMYLGEHYFMDVVAGLLYATVVFLACVNWHRIWRKRSAPAVVPLDV